MSHKYEKLATKIGAVVDSKQKAYGNSFNVSGEFLKLIYPNGIPADAYTDALCIVRIFDKLKRIGNASNLPVNEGKIDAWSDIIGYGLLGLQKDSEPAEEVSHLDFNEYRRQWEAAQKDKEQAAQLQRQKDVAVDILQAIETAKERHDSIVSCAICNKPLDMPITKEVLESGRPVVHEGCYREFHGG